MGLDFGALIPALAQGATSYMQGQRIGEHDREQRDALLHQRAFEEWAKKQQLAQSGRALDQRGEIEQLKLAAQQAIAALNNERALGVAKTAADARTHVGELQYAPDGSVDRTNTSRDKMNQRDNQTRFDIHVTPTAPTTKRQLFQDPQGNFHSLDDGTDIPPGWTPYNKPTGQGAGAGTRQQDMRRRELHSNFAKEPAVKDANALVGPLGDIRRGLSANSPMGDLAAVYSTIRMFDPKTGVRGQEIQLFGNAASIPERARRLLQQWQTGKQLTPQMRQDIQALMQQKQAEAESGMHNAQATYGQQVRDAGLTPADSAYIAPSASWMGKPKGLSGNILEDLK